MAEEGPGRRGWPAGVAPLDHTADVGLEVRADSLASLFERAAGGMRVLLEGEDAPSAGSGARTQRTVELEAEELGSLLVAWLRELLFLQQVEGQAFDGAAFECVDETVLRAIVSLRPAAPEPVREIKGVTYHALEAARTDGRWRARVIFDV